MSQDASFYRELVDDIDATPFKQTAEIEKVHHLLMVLYVSSSILICSMVGFVLIGVLTDRFSIVPYVADGSIYGCQPSQIPSEQMQSK